MKNIMTNKSGRLLLLLFLLLPLAAQANTVTEGKGGLTWTFSTLVQETMDGPVYDIHFENDFTEGMITSDLEMDIEPYGQLDEDGLPWVVWSRDKGDGYFSLHLSYFNGIRWSDPQELTTGFGEVNSRECQFRLRDSGKIDITFISHADDGLHVMFGIYKTWSGGWTEVGPVITLEDGHTAKQPNLFPIYNDYDLAQYLLQFIHVYPEGEGSPPPDRDGLWETIDQYLRVFSSGDTSPWFHVQ